MSSIIEGYNYDIFISYRQKDNKHDGWVTRFVEELKGELESTFKEEVSVYFDINPHDGLLETHDVDESLKEKLRCLIFIPIISRTYCDPKSFAWEHEFKAFVETASKDRFGLKIKLPNGNVAGRVLPLRIHDLDTADIKECESVLGGVLRGIEFIYKEAGIDKPLAPDDDEKKNLNSTKYGIQIIKVAHSIKEIILGMKNEPIQTVSEKEAQKESVKKVKTEEIEGVIEKPAKANKARFIIPSTVVALLIIATIIAYPKLFKRNTLERLRTSGERISVAVMPFQNMTNDTIWNVWQDGIQNEMITSLTNSEELKVRQTESISSLIQAKGLTNYASITPSIASKLSQKLDANVFIYGSIKQVQVGKTIRLNALLIDVKTENSLKSFQIDGTAEEILHLTDSLSNIVRNYLIIFILKKKEPPDLRVYYNTNSPEAYAYSIQGYKAYLHNDNPTAREWFLKAIEKDSNYLMPRIQIAFTYDNQGYYDQAKEWCLKFYNRRNQMPPLWELMADFAHARYFETPHQEIKFLSRILEFDDQSAVMHSQLGYSYFRLHQWDKATTEFEKSLEIYNNWKSKPLVQNYTILGFTYHATGQYKKEKRIYKKAERDFPESAEIKKRQAILALSENRSEEAVECIEKFRSFRKEASSNTDLAKLEAHITSGVAEIYYEAGIIDKAEEYYRQQLLLDSENTNRINYLAYLLINEDRNVIEGLELIDRALEIRYNEISSDSNFYKRTQGNRLSDYYDYMHTKGWGLYKQGKYQEALNILQKSWDIRREKAIYDHTAWLHLEAAKKAVKEKRNN